MKKISIMKVIVRKLVCEIIQWEEFFFLITFFLRVWNSSKLFSFYGCIVIIWEYPCNDYISLIVDSPVALTNLLLIKGIKCYYVYLICSSLVKFLVSTPNNMLSRVFFAWYWKMKSIAAFSLLIREFSWANNN